MYIQLRSRNTKRRKKENYENILALCIRKVKVKYFAYCEDTSVGFVLLYKGTIIENMYDRDLIRKLAAIRIHYWS